VLRSLAWRCHAGYGLRPNYYLAAVLTIRSAAFTEPAPARAIILKTTFWLRRIGIRLGRMSELHVQGCLSRVIIVRSSPIATATGPAAPVRLEPYQIGLTVEPGYCGRPGERNELCSVANRTDLPSVPCKHCKSPCRCHRRPCTCRYSPPRHCVHDDLADMILVPRLISRLAFLIWEFLHNSFDMFGHGHVYPCTL